MFCYKMGSFDSIVIVNEIGPSYFLSPFVLSLFLFLLSLSTIFPRAAVDEWPGAIVSKLLLFFLSLSHFIITSGHEERERERKGSFL